MEITYTMVTSLELSFQWYLICKNLNLYAQDMSKNVKVGSNIGRRKNRNANAMLMLASDEHKFGIQMAIKAKKYLKNDPYQKNI